MSYCKGQLYWLKSSVVVSVTGFMNLLYQDGANTTITVLRVPAGVSEYGWMLEKSHFVYM